MSRTNFQPKEFFTGTGTLSAYTFNFKITSKSELLIVVVDPISTPGEEIEIQRVRGTDTSYLSSVVYSDVGGTVTLLANLPSGYKLSIMLAPDSPTQPFEWRNKTAFSLKRIEDAMDFLAGFAQRLTFRANQSIRLHDTDNESTFNTMLPPGVSNNADCILAVKADGTGMDYGPTVTEVEGWKNDAEAAAVAAALSEANALASANAAALSETNAATSELNAATSASAAALSETNAATSETNALTAKTAAEAAQVAAENAASSTIWSHVVFLNFSDSPRTITDSDKGTLFVVDTTAGNFNFTLGLISSLNLAGPWGVGIKKSDPSGNIINIVASGSDQIDNGTSLTISIPNAGVNLVPDDSTSPDQWSSVIFGAGGGSAAPDLSGTIGVPAIIAAASGIIFSGTYYNNIKFVESNGGPIVISANPQIQPGTLIGQKLKLKFVGNTNTIEFNNGNGLDLPSKFISEDNRELDLWWNGLTWSQENRR